MRVRVMWHWSTAAVDALKPFFVSYVGNPHLTASTTLMYITCLSSLLGLGQRFQEEHHPCCAAQVVEWAASATPILS